MDEVRNYIQALLDHDDTGCEASCTECRDAQRIIEIVRAFIFYTELHRVIPDASVPAVQALTECQFLWQQSQKSKQ